MVLECMHPLRGPSSTSCWGSRPRPWHSEELLAWSPLVPDNTPVATHGLAVSVSCGHPIVMGLHIARDIREDLWSVSYRRTRRTDARRKSCSLSWTSKSSFF